MKVLTVRLPERVVAQIDAESRRRRVSKSDVIRERLEAGEGRRSPGATSLETIADLIGSIDDLPPDLSGRRKHYLTATGYGRKRPR